VLELVAGPTLAERLARGALPVAEALIIATQIAEALEAAHEHRIVHRDLKPANIKITPGGSVKVLDFGLAKAAADPEGSADGPSPSGGSAHETLAGVILGTAAYMSPEQAQGRPVDKRTDIWAFGCVLYEMLTGSPAFAGGTAPDTIKTILEHDPDWNAVPPTTPPSVVALLHRCLEKDSKRRLRDIGEAPIVLGDAIATPTRPLTTTATRFIDRRTLWMAVVVASVITGAVIWNVRPSPLPASQAITRLAVPVSSDQRPATLRGLAWSPDGRHLAYVSDQVFRLCVRAMDGSDTRVLPGTDEAIFPFFSPDGKWIGFFANGKLKRVPVEGGAVVVVFDLSSVGGNYGGAGAWRADDTIFFADGRGIWRISAAGGSPSRVTTVDRSKGETDHKHPLLLPDGQTLLYTLRYGPGWDEHQIVAQRLDSGERHIVVKGAATARYAPTGHLIYTRAGVMMAVRVDASRLEVSGSPIRLEETIREGLPNADYDVAADGSLAYVHQDPAAYDRLPVLVDRNGRAQPLPGVAPARYNSPRFSPDGRQLALEITAGISDLWIYDFARSSLTRLTTEGSSNFPVWTRDGKRIAYLATRSGSRNLFWKSVDGPATEERLTSSEEVQFPWSWSPDGTTLAFNQTGKGTGNDIWMLPLVGDRVAHPFLREPFIEYEPRFSPTGPWLAFVSNRSGRPEIYVQSYPEPSRRWQISTDGGEDPVWAGDGRELFYRSGDRVMSVAFSGVSTFKASTPRLLFAGDYARGQPPVDYDVHPDGQRFLMLQPSLSEPPVTHINVVLNWFEELKRRLPTAK
jgi:eukaryotic-like serine/threonine-protein kinase